MKLGAWPEHRMFPIRNTGCSYGVKRMKEDAYTAVLLMGTAFPAMKLDVSERIDVWVKTLEDLPGEALLAVIRQVIATETSPWGVTMGQVRRLVMEHLRPSSLPKPEAAWEMVLSQLLKVGWTGRPVLPDLVLAGLRQTVPWRTLCESKTDSLPSHRARFLEAYRALMESQVVEEATPPELRAELSAIKPAALEDGPPLLEES